mmetsp:Transcript_1936/g.12121  ORF Transcript_1936/g.12121 Transcript_1936/m.12121 type:complete len:387 (+) Transcript_1936:1162-2322(+)
MDHELKLSETFLTEIDRVRRQNKGGKECHLQSCGDRTNRLQSRRDETEMGNLLYTGGKTLAKLATLRNEHYHSDKQTINEYLEKKKEIFKLQMTLNSKLLEIKKLQDRSAHRKEALRKSEAMLVEDEECFENFIASLREKLSRAKRRLDVEREETTNVLQKISSTQKSAAEAKLDLQLLKVKVQDLPDYASVMQDMETYAYLLPTYPGQASKESDALDAHGILEILEALETRIMLHVRDPCFRTLTHQHSSSWYDDLMVVLTSEISFVQQAIQDAINHTHPPAIYASQGQGSFQLERNSSAQSSRYALLCSHICNLYESLRGGTRSLFCPVEQVHYIQSKLDAALSTLPEPMRASKQCAGTPGKDSPEPIFVNDHENIKSEHVQHY